jgi:ribonuclease HII
VDEGVLHFSIITPLLALCQNAYNRTMKHRYVVGIDEVGRGPIAGPVSVCAVLIPRNLGRKDFRGVRDSKKLSSKKREEWFLYMKDKKEKGRLNYAVASVGPKKIDDIGISKSIRLATKRAIDRLGVRPEECKVLLDGGLSAPSKFKDQKTIIKGEDKEFSIALASVIAKVTRDKKMRRLSGVYPHYLFEEHKGYGTFKHYQIIRKKGMCEIHRRSFIHL